MAISNTVRLNNAETLQNQSVSLTSVVDEGTSSYRAVPTGKYWVVLSVRAYNGEAASRKISFIIADADGTAHGCLSNIGTARITTPTLEEACWDGKVILPAGWRLYTKWHAMTGGSTVNWQYTVIEREIQSQNNVKADWFIPAI